jgi:sugar transferase (PEP-CTERM/EpsH1 system associated)
LVLFFKKELLPSKRPSLGAMTDIVYLCHRMPWPPVKGEKIRAWHVLRHLARHFRVHVGTLADAPGDMAQVAHLETVAASVGAFAVRRPVQMARALVRARPGRPLQPDFCASPGLARWVDATVARARPAGIFISTVAMAPYALGRPGVRLWLDAMDIDSEKWAAYGRDSAWPMRLVWAREGRNLLAYEKHAASACEATFFVSQPEARRFAELAPECAARVDYAENGVDLMRFNPSHVFASPFGGAGPAAVFTGHMAYRPNIEGVTWFAREVLPLVQARVAGVSFWIVGADPSPPVVALGKLPGVHVTGTVADTRPYLAHAAAVVCPLRIARGIQNKVLEAMAAGRTVIASPGAFEGVRAEAGRDLLVAESAADFGAAVISVLAGAHPDMGARARAAMEAHYDWDATLARMDRWLAPRADG